MANHLCFYRSIEKLVDRLAFIHCSFSLHFLHRAPGICPLPFRLARKSVGAVSQWCSLDAPCEEIYSWLKSPESDKVIANTQGKKPVLGLSFFLTIPWGDTSTLAIFLSIKRGFPWNASAARNHRPGSHSKKQTPTRDSKRGQKAITLKRSDPYIREDDILQGNWYCWCVLNCARPLCCSWNAHTHPRNYYTAFTIPCPTWLTAGQALSHCKLSSWYSSFGDEE